MDIVKGFKVLRQIPPIQLYRKALHYGKNKSGLTAWLEPAGTYTRAAAVAKTSNDQSIAARRAEGTPALLRELSAEGKSSLLASATRIAHQRIVPYFQWDDVWLSSPPNFFWDPQHDVHWPADRHSSTYVQFDRSLGDIKRVWEANRLTYLTSTLPIETLGSEEDRRQGLSFFREIVSAWLDASPPRLGVAWACGQEVSIRSVAILVNLHHRGLRAADVDARLGSYFEYAAEQVAKHIGFARSQRNNHAITEACFLILYGRLLPEAKKAGAYYALGVRILLESIGDQFFADGAYIQNSHTYHRFALQSILLVGSLDASILREPAVTDCLKQSYRFLEAHRVPGTNTLPNYGPNDGALLYNFGSRDYRNFEPLLHALAYALDIERAVRHELDLVDALYLFPERAAHRSTGARPLAVVPSLAATSSAFSATGYYILRNSATSVYFRCGSYDGHAPSQNDALHVDLWCDGEEVFVDSGTFEYFSVETPGKFRDYLSTRAHNTASVSDLDQLEKGPNFTFLTRLSAQLLDHEADRVSGEHYGFRGRVSPDCVHKRTVELVGERTCVTTDTIAGAQGRRVRIFWHVASTDVEQAGNGHLTWGTHQLYLSSDQDIEIDVAPAERSLYYAAASAITLVTVSFIGGNDEVEVRTRWEG